MSQRRGASPGRCLAALSSVLALSAGSVLLSVPAASALPTVSLPTASAASAFVREFAAANADHGAMFRWWWPSSVVPAVAVVQLEEVAKAGYKGVEIAFVMDGANYVVDPDKYEYGDANWRAAVKAVLARAQELGVQVDLTLGGRWPAAIPGLDVSTDSASQELVTAYSVVAAGADLTTLPQPTARTYQDRTVEGGVVSPTTKTSVPHLVSAVVAKCVNACGEAQPKLDLTTVQELEYTTDGQVDWTAPDEGTWVAIAGWQRGTAQRNDAPFGTSVSPLSDPESRVINHFDDEGTEAFIRWFNRLLDPETRRLLKSNGGSIFEDSLELNASQLWTSEFFDAFADQHGYDLRDFLPVLGYKLPASPFAPKASQYAFADANTEMVTRVRADVDATLDHLWTTQHLRPITEWANGLGLTFRAQPYGEAIDLGAAAAELGVTECESLGCSETQFRTAAGGVALAGKTILSSEMLPGGFGNLYGLTPAQIAALANKEYSLGANQMVFHGLPYPNIPPSADGTIVDNAAAWPGFHGFTSNIGEAFGPRQATWTMEPDIADYYARMQQTLQAGTARYDIAVLNQNPEGDPALNGSFLDSAGYTYSYATPGSLKGQTVSGGVLDATGPAFKALIIGSAPLNLSDAIQIERLAKAGLTVMVVAGGPTRASGWAADASAAAAEDKAVRRTIDRIVGLRGSYEADSTEEALEVLADEGIKADAAVSVHGVKVIERKDGNNRYYVLINRTSDAVSVDASLAGGTSSIAYRMNPWSGKTEPFGVSSRSGGRVSISKVKLAAGAAAIVALANRSFTPGAESTKVVSTTAFDARFSKGRVIVRADDNGIYRTTLSNGRSLKTTVSGVPAKLNLTSWDLTLDEWLPGEATDASSLTQHEQHVVSGAGAKPWTELDGLADAVGVGSYTTTVQASGRLAAASAVLDLGKVQGSYRVYVNGKRITTPDQLGAQVDLASALKPGANTIRVEVASTLLNRLRVHRASEFGSRTPTVNGLVGPVILDPYREVASK